MSRRHWIISFVCVLLLAGGLLWRLLGWEPAQEGRATLRCKAVGDPRKDQVVSLSWQVLEFAASCPNDVHDLPNGFNQPRFSHVAVGPGSLPAVLDVSGKPRLCLDGNRDGLLSNEPCLHARTVRVQPQEPYWRFGPIQARLRPEENGESSAFYVLYRVSSRDKMQGGSFYPGSLYPAYYRCGKVRLNGRVYQVAVVDGDYDGRFDSLLTPPLDRRPQLPACDVLAIDRNRDGKFECSLTMQSEVAPLSRLILLDDKYYAVNVTPDGGRLEFIPAEPEQGQLMVDTPDAKLQLRLQSDAADQYLFPAAAQWHLPAGEYRTLWAVLRLRDSIGNEWAFGTGSPGGLAAFEIRPEQVTRLRGGPPFVVTTRIQQVNREWVSINLVIVGCAGEEYQADFQRNGRRPAERTFKIVDEKGTVLVADKFQYG